MCMDKNLFVVLIFWVIAFLGSNIFGAIIFGGHLFGPVLIIFFSNTLIGLKVTWQKPIGLKPIWRKQLEQKPVGLKTNRAETKIVQISRSKINRAQKNGT